MVNKMLLTAVLLSISFGHGDSEKLCAVGVNVPEPPADWIGWKYTWQDDRFNHWLSCTRAITSFICVFFLLFSLSLFLLRAHLLIRACDRFCSPSARRAAIPLRKELHQDGV